MVSNVAPVGPVSGRVDRDGRLVAADAALATLQSEAGSHIGARLALPQIAAVARLARELGVPVARAAIAAGANVDYDLWVRATLDGDEVQLSIEGWRERAPIAPRLDLVLAVDDDPALSDVAGSGTWSTDGSLILTAIAPDLAERLGIEVGEAVGQPLTKFLKLEEDEAGALPILAALGARTSFAGQRAVARATSGVPIDLSADALHDDSGGFAGFSGRAVPQAPMMSLVGDEVDGGSELDRALRTPLDRIIAAADKIVERSDGPLRGDYASYAQDIAAAGRHLLSVVHAMSEQAIAPAEAVDLIGAASEAIALVAASGQAKRISVDLMASARVEARGDKRGIVQIIVNILGNAIRYSPEESVVTIGITVREGRAILSITDQGPGIPVEDQARIFQRFERLGNAQPGTGLGLAISRRLAEEMGGTIQLDSAVGQGARFTLDLPAA